MRSVKLKLTSILVIAFTLASLLSLSSCNRSYDEDEVVEAAERLLKEAEMLNIIYYGSGIKYYESDDDNGYYRKADLAHLEELGFSTIDELKVLTEMTFSDEYSALLYSTILSAISTDTGVAVAARYYQAYDEETKEPTEIMVYSVFTPMLKDSITYDYGSLKVKGSKKEKVYVSVSATVTSSEGKSQNTEITITLVEEDDGWKIDNPTYANYNESKDRYDELKDKELK